MSHETAISPWDVFATTARLRGAHARILEDADIERIITALAAVGDAWRDEDSEWRKMARQSIRGTFGIDAVDYSLRALLDSLQPHRLWQLIEDEGIAGRDGFPVIGHVIAGNTPLLGWVSLIRALLVRSASHMKLPKSAAAAMWTTLFYLTLIRVDKDLSDCIHLDYWTGGNEELNAAFCTSCDLVVAYGSDSTIASLRAHGDGKPFLGYGHRLSVGVVLLEADMELAAAGLALDVLLYDQCGCLSPHAVYVEGPHERSAEFSGLLADALKRRAPHIPEAPRTPAGMLAVRQARGLARMASDVKLWEDKELRWTVELQATSEFVASPTYCVVSVLSFSDIDELEAGLSPVRGFLQGAAVALPDGALIPDELMLLLSDYGATYFCAPGELQSPPLAWPQDGISVLYSLVEPPPSV